MAGPLKSDPFSQEAIEKDPNKYGKQAYLVAHNARFAKFAAELKPDATFDYLHHSEEFICTECNVPALEGKQALRWIDSSPESIEKWTALKARYDTWLTQHGE